MNKKHLGYWGLIGILIIAAVMRLYKVTAIALWHDEAFSALLINYPWHEMFYRIGLDVHPPIYYITLRLWADLLGHSVLSLRGFSVFFGVATVYATYLFVNSAFKKQSWALAAALLLAISPFQIQFVTEARMYTFGTFLIMISAYFLSEALQAQNQYLALQPDAPKPKKVINRLWGFWLLFAIATSLSIYTHYYLFFSTAALGLFVIYYQIRHGGARWADWRYSIGAYVLVFLSYIPWLKTFWFQFHQVQASYWIPPISTWSIPGTNWTILTGGAGVDISQASTHIFLVLGCLIFLLFLILIIAKVKNDFKWLIISAVIIPFIGAVLLSYKQSIYQDRYFIFAALFYTIIVAMFIVNLRWTALRYIFFALVILSSLINWNNFWQHLDIEHRQGMAAAAAYLNSHVRPGDKLDVGSSFEFFNFKYYNKTGIPPLLYTPGIRKVSDLPHYSGTALLSDSDLIHDFNADTKPGDTVWLLWTNGFGGNKPAIPGNWAQEQELGWADVRPWVGTYIYVDKFIVK